MTEDRNIYDFVKTEEQAFDTTGVTVAENYEWLMKEHIRLTVLYKNAKYSEGSGKNKPFKNIIRPILNLQYRAEGFDVKDIELFVDEAKNYYKSFLIKKYHEKWARENEIDTFIDELVEAYVDFGGALVKDINEVRPEVVPWQRIAFCDQTDVLSGPICEKHFYAPDQLKDMEAKGWENIDEVITQARQEKTSKSGKKSATPGKYIEVYEVHGMFPEPWLQGDEAYVPEDTKYSRQLHIITFYKDDKGTKHGITLFSGKEKELPYKLICRDKQFGRALGIGGAEELFEPQVWINYDIIRMKELLDQASKVIYQTTDSAFTNRNSTSEVDNGDILVVADGKQIAQINTVPVNIRLFENAVNEWEAHAQQMGAANDALMGEPPTSGTPFKLQELVTAEGHSLHEYRKGKLATFVDGIYRDWVLPYLSREITNGQQWLAELDLDELQSVAQSLMECETNNMVKEKILNGELIAPDEIATYKQAVRDQFMKGGNKKFMEILKGELKSAPLDVRVNIVGKQKNLAQMTDKLVNIFRTIIAAPGVLQNPGMAKLFNQILESSGLDPVDFTSFTAPAPTPQPNPALPPGAPPNMMPQQNMIPQMTNNLLAKTTARQVVNQPY